jgi:hypothetical protein
MAKKSINEELKNEVTSVFEDIKKEMAILEENNDLFILNNNKQASRRSRTASSKLTTLLKDYRKLTLASINSH